MNRFFVGFVSFGFLASVCLFAQEPESPAPKFKTEAARAAEVAYLKAVGDAEQDYAEQVAKARKTLIASLEEAKTAASKGGKLDEAVAIRDRQKEMAEASAATPRSRRPQETALRNRLAGSVWKWDPGDAAQAITLRPDGTINMTWQPTAKGFWHVNPDLTVTIIADKQMGGLMSFNKDYTTQQTVFPGVNISRGGIRVK
jgi:hypothetical protein